MEYFRVQQPAFEKIRTVLALFAVFVLIRSLLQHLYNLRRRNLSKQNSTENNPWPPVGLEGHCSEWPGSEKSQDSRFPIMMKENAPASADSHDGMYRTTKLSLMSDWRNPSPEALPREITPRLPPAPPLTPPEMSPVIFNLVPGQPHAIDHFIQQPNPDYMSSTTSAVLRADPASPVTSRRHSYHRILPIGIPASRQSHLADVDPATTLSLPSSYPSTNPLLPPPPGLTEASDDQVQQDVNIKGEVVSVLDNDGAGWSRHTRIYGGGVCLACAAAGGEHGGFYGSTVTAEEMRYGFYAGRNSSGLAKS